MNKMVGCQVFLLPISNCRNYDYELIKEKEKETIDLIKRIMDVKLNPDYVTSDVGTLQRMISKII